MAKEVMFLVVYLFGIQPVLYGYFLTHGYGVSNTLLIVGVITTGVLSAFFLFSYLCKRWCYKPKSITLEIKETDLQSRKSEENKAEKDFVLLQKYHKKSPFLDIKLNSLSTFFQRYLLGIGLYLLTVLIVIYPFVEYGSFLLIIVVVLMIKLLLASLLLYAGKIYIHRRLLVPKDIVLLLSVWLWSFGVFFFRSFERYISWGIASLVSLVFSWIVIKGCGLVKHYSIRRLGLIRIYGIFFLVSFVRYIVTLYNQVDELLVSSFNQKFAFMRYEIKQEVEKVKTVGLSFSLRNIFGDKKESYQSINKRTDQELFDDRDTFIQKTGQENVFLSGTNSGIFQNNSGVKKDFFTLSDNETGSIQTSTSSNISFSSGSSGASLSFIGSKDSNDFVTYRKAFRYLFNSSQLAKINVSFVYIPKTDPDYWYFTTAYKWGMIGKSIKPDSYVLCDTYIVMKGIKQGWKVYVPNPKDPFTPYRQKATQLKQLNGCQRGKYVKKTTL